MDILKMMMVAEYKNDGVEILKELGAYEAYRNNVLTTVKKIAQKEEEVASDLEADKDDTIDKIINTLAIKAIKDDSPAGILTNAFSWNESPEGAEYWYDITTKFCEKHPMVGKR